MKIAILSITMIAVAAVSNGQSWNKLQDVDDARSYSRLQYGWKSFWQGLRGIKFQYNYEFGAADTLPDKSSFTSKFIIDSTYVLYRRAVCMEQNGKGKVIYRRRDCESMTGEDRIEIQYLLWSKSYNNFLYLSNVHPDKDDESYEPYKEIAFENQRVVNMLFVLNYIFGKVQNSSFEFMKNGKVNSWHYYEDSSGNIVMDKITVEGQQMNVAANVLFPVRLNKVGRPLFVYKNVVKDSVDVDSCKIVPAFYYCKQCRMIGPGRDAVCESCYFGHILFFKYAQHVRDEYDWHYLPYRDYSDPSYWHFEKTKKSGE